MPDKPDTTLAPQDQDVLQHRKPRHLRLAGSVALGVLTSVVALGLVTRVVASRETQGWTNDQATPIVQLVTLKAADGNAFTLPGDIEPFTNATIYAQISGYVQQWLVDIGKPVKAGQLLAQIDPRPYQATLDQAKGNLARDIATLGEAELDEKRYQTLASQNAISAQQLTTQEATVKADEGIVETDKAAVETAQINLDYTRIVAPFDGVVTSRSLDVGQLVTAGNASATPLFTVTDQNRLRVYVHIPQSYSGLIHQGMTASFTVPEHPGRVFTATLVASADAIVTLSGTQLVQFQIDNSDHALKPGDYATMNFGAGAGRGGVRVPVTAVMFRDQGMMVASVGPDGKVAMKSIQIDTDFGTAVEVDAGLKIGDKIIDNPPDSLRPGDAVKIASSSAS